MPIAAVPIAAASVATASIATVLKHESAVRLGAFVSVFVVFALFERVRPRRDATAKTGRRWLGNAAMFAIDVALVRILVPAGAAFRGHGR